MAVGSRHHAGGFMSHDHDEETLRAWACVELLFLVPWLVHIKCGRYIGLEYVYPSNGLSCGYSTALERIRRMLPFLPNNPSG